MTLLRHLNVEIDPDRRFPRRNAIIVPVAKVIVKMIIVSREEGVRRASREPRARYRGLEEVHDLLHRRDLLRHPKPRRRPPSAFVPGLERAR